MRRLARWTLGLLLCGALGAPLGAHALDAPTLREPLLPDPAQPQHPTDAPAPKPSPPALMLPDAPTFEGLLMDLGRPQGLGQPHGLKASSVGVALRAGAPALAPGATTRDLDVLRAPALDAPLAALPLGGTLGSLLAPETADAGAVRLRDLGRLATSHNSLLMRTERSLFGESESALWSTRGVAALLAAAVVARMGTARASALGLAPRGHVTLFGGALDQAVALHCDPGLKNAAVDLSSRLHLMRFEPTVSFVRDVSIEGAVTAQRGGTQGLLPERQLRLRLESANLDGAVGWHDPPTGPPVWSLEAVAHAGAFRLHSVLWRESVSGKLGATGALMSGLGPTRGGFFVGAQSGQGVMAGVVGMAAF
ncbi:MAG: hypothetical protein JST54_04945 [Deltaproteobacteria bacterium]|nr:hypothetical protein [Deltaproteobacteria bacterium]